MNKTIHELNEISQIESTDEMIVYDVSDGTSKKAKVGKITESYSTTEQKTGGTWIDGKPIYKKTISDTYTSYTDSSKRREFIIALDSNINEVVNYSYIANFDNNVTRLGEFLTPTPAPFHAVGIRKVGANPYELVVALNKDIYSVTSIQMKLTIEYTKTTD